MCAQLSRDEKCSVTHSDPMGRIKKRSFVSCWVVRGSLTDSVCVCVKLYVGVFQMTMLKRILSVKG